MRRKWKKRISLFLRGWIGSIVVALLIATSFKSAIADWNVVPTGSMKPTIVEGDRIFVNKLAYDLKVPYTTWHIAKWGDPNCGDIVVFYSPTDGRRLVKRVIGLPGDSIVMRDNRLFINGIAVVYEPFNPEMFDVIMPEVKSHHCLIIENIDGRRHPVMITRYHLSLSSFGPFNVPDDRYFMLGDNRDNSADSRYFGFVERHQIIGKAPAIVASLDPENYYTPRFGRFFTKLP